MFGKLGYRISSALLVTVVSVLALYAVTSLYLRVYRAPRENAISRDLDRLYVGGNGGGEKNGSDNGGDGGHNVRRDRVLRLRRSLGVGIDSLPTVRFGSSNDYDDDDDDDDGTRERAKKEAELRARQRECLTVGLYLSPVDDYVDCRAYCGVTDGVEYKYYDRLGLMLNGRMGRTGSYCMPNDAAVCNESTALAVYSRDGWRCLPQTRAFAGEGGNLIVACNGSLLDRATGKLWRRHLDPTLAFESVDELLPDDGGYRFVCPPGETDRLGNVAIPAPFDRLILLENRCASLIPYASTDVRPDFEHARCECGANARVDPKSGLCVPSTRNNSDGYDSSSMECSLRGITPCVETWSVASSFEHGVIDDGTLVVCGTENGAVDQGRSYPACVETHAMLFDRPVPSPYAMLESSNLVARLSVTS